ncbi:DUF2380 domain-containing protein [Mesorhizobium sp. KR1-2]|uniref:DUF2380 domain-containing protein n=1 Tax=Mesorhizobium sp. KR1-2 TaxID=3156609 RepID=UPI0032B55152
MDSRARKLELGQERWAESLTSMARRAVLVALMCLLGIAALTSAHAAENRPSLAISGFFLIDTSGEQRNQTAEHEARLKRFDDVMHEELAGSGRFTLVEMKCPQPRCSGQSMTMDELLRYARDAGARFLAVGAIEKMSTLVLWARLEVYDVASRKMVFNQLFTFRGDNDEAWQHAAHYVANEFIKNAPTQ